MIKEATVRLSPTSSCVRRGRRRGRRKCTWGKCHLPSSIQHSAHVSGSDTRRRTRIFRLSFLTSGVTSFAAQFAWSVLKKSRRLVKPILQCRIVDFNSIKAVNFHPPAQRNAFRRRDAHQQSRSFACWNQSLTRSPNSSRLYRACLR
jgi:hypothetical protein